MNMTISERVVRAIRVAALPHPSTEVWASRWLSGEDRTAASADEAADRARWAEEAEGREAAPWAWSAPTVEAAEAAWAATFEAGRAGWAAADGEDEDALLMARWALLA